MSTPILTTGETAELDTPRVATPPSGSGKAHPRYGTHLLLIAMSVLWLAPLLWTLYTSLRSKADTDKHTYWSIAKTLSFKNYSDAWSQGGFGKAFTNSAIITIPSVLLTIGLASMVAFAVARFTWKFNVTVLILFTAGNMLPPQVLAAPLFEMAKHTPLPYSASDSGSFINTYYSVIAVDVAFQLGFCTFVLSNYMKALPADLTEAALMDGCGVWRMYRQIILPLCRPALAALGTLEVIWIYNDFFWPLLFIQRGDRLPVTTAIQNLQGEFLSNYNLIAAGATITLVPTLVVYLALQRQFVAGLTLGGSKG
ncbi:MAG: carbohydrate ABC transporter permease [Jatrophihabitans sp.]